MLTCRVLEWPGFAQRAPGPRQYRQRDTGKERRYLPEPDRLEAYVQPSSLSVRL